MTIHDESIAEELIRLGVNRLTHFTPSKNLPQIFAAGALLATSDLDARGLSHSVTDTGRYDGRRDLICCNIEFPNAYYFRQARTVGHLINYPDWVVFLINPSIGSRSGAQFSPYNAAKGRGSALVGGIEGFRALWATQVNGRSRGVAHRESSPTDVQAEALIPSEIPLAAVEGVVTPSAAHAMREQARLRYLGYDPQQVLWYAASDLFDAIAVTRAVREKNEIELIGPIPLIEETVGE